MRFLIATVYALLGVSVLSASAMAQGLLDNQPEFLTIEYIHTMEINGETATAKGRGFGDLTSGVMVIDFTIDHYIPGYSLWASSVVTNAGTGGGPIVTATADGGPSPWYTYLVERDGPLEIEKITRDRYADLLTNFSVTLEKQTLIINVTTQGKADYPTLVGMAAGPMVYRNSATKSGLSEFLDKSLITASKQQIQTNVVVNYPSDVSVAYRERETRVAVLNESEDSLRIRLVYANTLR